MPDPFPASNTARPSLREIKASGGRWGLGEFVEVANGLVELYLPARRSYNLKLRGVFNPRLVRYYTTFGLISPPAREGKAARYSYGQLLQALVIRRLLFEGYTAPALLKMLAGKKEADYEAMLAGGVSTAAAGVAREEVDGPIAAPETPEHPRLGRELLAAAPAPSGPTSTQRPPPLPAPTTPPSASAPPARAETAHWRRVEVAPGLELHIRADFLLPATQAAREPLLRAMLEGLQAGPRAA